MARNAVKVIPPAKSQAGIQVFAARQPARIMARKTPPKGQHTIVEEYEDIVETRTVRRKRVEEAPQAGSLDGETGIGFASRVASVLFLWVMAAFLIIAGVVAVAMDHSIVGALFVIAGFVPLLSGVSINNYGRGHA